MNYDNGFQDGVEAGRADTVELFKEKINDMKCCGNCKHYYYKEKCVLLGDFYSVCNDWTFDGITRAEREI